MRQELQTPLLSGLRWLMYCKREIAPGFDGFKKKVFARDSNRCYHCGFVAKSYMRVMNRDGNYRNNVLSNLYTVCPLCFWSCFLDYSASGRKKRGVLIYMPEISQSNLIGLAHASFCSVSSSTIHEQTAEDMHKSLKLRSKLIEDTYGEGRSDPGVFCQMLLNSTNVDASLAGKLLHDIRWLPLMSGFSDEIVAWSEEAVANSS